MRGRWFGSLFGPTERKSDGASTAESRSAPDSAVDGGSDSDDDASESDADNANEFYECSYCQATFDRWFEACPECDQLVVRMVGTAGE